MAEGGLWAKDKKDNERSKQQACQFVSAIIRGLLVGGKKERQKEAQAQFK